jgi:two-component system nitrogen regulation sensor histidine kinase NtrY
VAVVTIFSLLLVVPAGLYFSARTRREFERLTGGAMRVASGDFSRPVDTSGEGEFADLAESFNRMMRQLTDYRERLIVSQKIAAWQLIGRKIAHEVKNPLTPITIAVDDLRHTYRDRPGDYEKVLEECSTTIKGEVNRLLKLIDQFSSFAKMPPPEFSTVSPVDFIRDILVLFKDEKAQGKLIIENVRGDVPLQIDPEQMHQVVINLIKNSLEAGCEHCALKLESAEGRFVMTIEDDGPGLPARLLDEGPTPYFSTKEHGSGLGLIICQRIVFDHDGTMTIDNKPDGGARVIITLPEKHAQDTSR